MDTNKVLVPSGFPGVNMHLGDHICHFHYGYTHLLTKVVPFISAGLDNNEKCLIYLEPKLKTVFRKLMGEKSLLAEKDGNLEFIEPSFITELYIYASVDRIEQYYIREAEKTTALGFKALRITGQVEIILAQTNYAQMIFIETVTNRIIKKLPIVGLCEYPFQFNLPKDFLIQLRRMHSYLLSGEKLIGDNRQLSAVSTDLN